MFFIVLVVFLAFGFAPLLLPVSSGLSNAQPIGPYLNGVFTPQVPTGPDSVNYTIENAFPNLTFRDPVKLLELPNGQLFVLGKSGDAWVFNNDSNTAVTTQVLNIEPQVSISGDAGMLGAALHPEFGQPLSANAQYIYIWYRHKPVGSSQGNLGYMRLSRFTINSSYTNIDPASEYVMIQQYDRHQWHNGGDMFFGMDDFLYIAVGDEGGANDQFNRTQSISDWLFGGVLRIDVDMQGGNISHPIRRQPANGGTPPNGWDNSFTQGYFIPNDNPWLDANGSILEEFWALGTRSPHRMTLDTVTGNIWLGDIGQGTMEEISLVKKEANLQWPYMEGTVNGPKAKPNPLIGFDQTPVFAYPRTFGTCVIGGHVIRGGVYPELEGRYIFGDHVNQNVWTLELSPVGTSQNLEFLLNVPVEGSGSKDGISSFATTSDGTIYILDMYATNTDGGKIHKLVRQPHGGVPEPANALSQLGVFTDMATLEVASGIIPYTVNAPLWSDGSTKKRWIAIPNDGVHDTPAEQVSFDPDDFWTFPAGTVMIKHFELPLDPNDPSQQARLETRFFIYGTGQPYGLSYRWNEQGTDAYLIDGAEVGDWRIGSFDEATYAISGGNGFSRSFMDGVGTFTLDIYQLDNSFNVSINGVDLNGEIEFQGSGQNKATFQDGDAYGIGGIPSVWTLTGNSVDPLIRLTVNPAGNVSLYGAKSSGGPLFPMTMTTSPSVVNWNSSGTNLVELGQQLIGPTNCSGVMNYAVGPQFTQTWSFPSREQCMTCHNSGAGFALGLKAHQLNGDQLYATTGIVANQIETWDFLNMFDGPIPDVDQLRRSYGIDDISVSAEKRVMSYIDANCAHCHRNGQVDGAFDARYHLPIEQKGIIGDAIGMNTSMGQQVIAFGDTLGSELWVRDSKEDGEVNIMPPLARSLVDEKYIEVLTEWIMRADTAHASTARTELEITVLLEAAWNGTTMDDVLRTQELVPNAEPYHSIYGHVGQGGNEYAERSTLEFEEGVSVVDWVLVELRHDVMSELVQETYSALLLSNGKIIDPQGGPLVIGTASEDYHVAVRHRNHLGVMTAQPIVFSGGAVQVDFSDPQTNTWGTEAQRNLSGKMVLWMGNANASSSIKYTGAANDRDAILLRIGGSVPTNTINGYYGEDVNMDGVVKYTGAVNDRDFVLLNIGGSVPTNVRVEQLP